MERINKIHSIPVWEKYTLTILEACEYFNIGEDKMRKIVNDNLGSEFLMTNGTKHLIKRKLFEKFIDETSSI